MREKNYSIEFLRIVFTLYIVLRHVLATVGIDNSLWLGVEFFFVLSGFLLCVTFDDRQTFCGFVLKRYLRFAPIAVWGCILCAFFRPLDLMSLIANAFLISGNGFLGGQGAFNPPTWYLSVLLWVGSGYFLVLRYFKTVRLPFLVTVVAILLLYLNMYGFEQMFCSVHGLPSGWHRYVRGVAEIGIGCIAGLFYAGDKRVKCAFCGVVEVMIFAIAIFAPVLNVYHDRMWLVSLLVIMYAFLIILLMDSGTVLSRILNRKAFAYCSKYALSVFATHYAVVYALMKFEVDNMRWIWAVGSVMVSLMVGVASYHLIERPMAKVTQNLWERL